MRNVRGLESMIVKEIQDLKGLESRLDQRFASLGGRPQQLVPPLSGDSWIWRNGLAELRSSSTRCPRMPAERRQPAHSAERGLQAMQTLRLILMEDARTGVKRGR
jgi:hypothetical protein